VRYNGGGTAPIILDLSGDINVALSTAYSKSVSGFELVSASLSSRHLAQIWL
jgi:hypothetical protein